MADSNLKTYITIEAIDNYTKMYDKVKKNVREVEKTVESSNKKIVSDQSQSIKKQIGMYDALKRTALAYFSFSFLKGAVQGFVYRDKYVSKIKAITHASNKELDVFNKQLKEKTKNSTTTIDEILTGSLAGAKSGIKIDKLAEFSKITDEVFVGAGQKAESFAQTAETVGVVLNSFNGELEDLTDIMSIVIDKSNAMNLNEFGQSLSKTAPYTKKFNADMASTMSLLTAFTDTGVSGAVASTKISSIFKAIESRGIGNIGAQLGLGKNFTLEGRNGIVLLEKLKEKYGNLTSDMRIAKLSKLFGKGDATTSLNTLIDQLDKVKKKYDLVTEGAKGFRRQASDAVSGGAYGDYMRLIKVIDSLKITLGSIVFNTGILQYVKELADKVDYALEKGKELVSTLKTNVGNMEEGKTKDLAEDALGAAGAGGGAFLKAHILKYGIKKAGLTEAIKSIGSKAATSTLKAGSKIGMGAVAKAGVGLARFGTGPVGFATLTAAEYLLENQYDRYKKRKKNQNNISNLNGNMSKFDSMPDFFNNKNNPQEINITIDNQSDFALKATKVESKINNTNILTRQKFNNR